MKGLILSGGFGTRLRPLTYSQQKQLIPVANKPILFYGIEDLIEAGIHDIGIIVGPNKNQVINTVNKGNWDAHIEFIEQDAPLGIAHTIKISKNLKSLTKAIKASIINIIFINKLYRMVFMENKNFDKLVKEFFNLSVKRNPDMGSFIGLHQYDDKLPNESRETYIEDGKIMRRYLKRFRRIDASRLSEERKLDRELVIHELRLGIFFNSLRLWECNPDITDGFGSILFLLVVRDFAPIEKRMLSVIKRLEKIPKSLEATKKRIRRPYKLWTEIAIESCDRFIVFLKSLNSIRLKPVIKKRLEKAVENAIADVLDYKNYVKEVLLPKSIDRYSLGRDNFEKLIKLRELGMKTDDILNLGRRYLREYKKQLNDTARKINPNMSLKEVNSIIESKHPKAFKGILKEYESSVLDAKKFIISKK